MNETLATERQLFRAYEIVFEALLNGLVIAVAALLIAAIVLIILCCRQTRAIARQRDAELAAACEAELRKVGSRIVAPNQGGCRERTQRSQRLYRASLSSMRSLVANLLGRRNRLDASGADSLSFPR